MGWSFYKPGCIFSGIMTEYFFISVNVLAKIETILWLNDVYRRQKTVAQDKYSACLTMEHSLCLFKECIGMPVILFSCPIAFSPLNFCLIFSMDIIRQCSNLEKPANMQYCEADGKIFQRDSINSVLDIMWCKTKVNTCSSQLELIVLQWQQRLQPTACRNRKLRVKSEATHIYRGDINQVSQVWSLVPN